MLSKVFKQQLSPWILLFWQLWFIYHHKYMSRYKILSNLWQPTQIFSRCQINHYTWIYFNTNMLISRKLTFTGPTHTAVKGLVFSLLPVILKDKDSPWLQNTRSPHAWAMPGTTQRQDPFTRENREAPTGRNTGTNTGSHGRRRPPDPGERALPAARGDRLRARGRRRETTGRDGHGGALTAAGTGPRWAEGDRTSDCRPRKQECGDRKNWGQQLNRLSLEGLAHRPGKTKQRAKAGRRALENRAAPP